MSSFLSAIPQRLRRWLVIVIAVFLFYTVFGFLIVPVILKSQILKRLPPLTHRVVAVEQIRFNPYTFALTVRGFSLKEPDGADFAGFVEFHINFQLISAFKRGFVFKEIHLVSPAAHILFNKDGTPSFANLLSTNPPPPKTEPSKPLPLVIVESLSISNGLVSFTDLRQHTPFQTRFEPLYLQLHNFTTRAKSDAPYSFTAATGEGESFSWAGDIAVNPPSSRGRFQLTGLPLPKYTPYLESFVTFQTTRGTLDVGAQYLLDASTTNLVLNVTNATVTTTNQTVAPVVPITPPTKPAGKVINFTWGARTNTPVVVATKTITPTTVTNQLAVATQSPADMETALLSKMVVTENDLRQLMKDRAVKVQTLLLQQKEPPETERLFLTNPEIPKPDPANPSKPRVNLSLQ